VKNAEAFKIIKIEIKDDIVKNVGIKEKTSKELWNKIKH
jgi:hypothetical protein